MKKITTAFSFILISAFVLSGINQASADFKKPANSSALSTEGQRAFEDLGRCLQSQGKNKVLDVFYLIDESGSLQDTDPKNSRAEILSSSLLQLASFRKGVTVNYSVGFFAHSYSVWKPWTTVRQGSIISEASRLDSEVRGRNRGKMTDWLQGVNGAINELNAQHERTQGCSSLIWLTDGGIQLKTGEATANAVAELCENRLDVARKNRITVLGVLLADEDYLGSLTTKERETQDYFMSLIRPIVEGSGKLSDGTNLKCGASPVPANYSQGAVFIASDPSELAFEFLKLPPRIEGCQASVDFESKPTEFEVEQGISDFQIVTTSSNWSLKNPEGKTLTSTSPGIKVFDTAGASQIRVGTNSSGRGKWVFSGGSSKSELFLCSGLDIVINPGTVFVAGKAGILSGRVIFQNNDKAADLSVYDSDHPITVEQIGANKSGGKQEAEQSDPSNFVIKKFTPAVGQGESEIRITLNLTTKSGFKLAPISVSQKLDVRQLSNYPTLKNDPVQLRDLLSATEPAKGTALFIGSTKVDGKVCIDPKSQPIVVSDKYDRQDTYELKTSGLDIDGCTPVRAGERVEIGLTISNSVTAKSDVVMALPVTYYSDADPGKPLILNAPVVFKSHFPGEEDQTFWVTFLTILGLLLPLLLISLMSWLTTKLAFGRQVQRATYAVMVTPSDRYTARDGTAIVPDPNDFKIRPEQPDVRSFEDSIGKFRARISALVLASPWFEVKASEGTRVITLAHAAPQLKHRFSSGKVAPIPGDLAKIWALSIQDSDLLKFEKGTAIPGTLVVFKRNNLSNTNQFRDVFNGVTTKAGIWREVSRLAEVVKNETAKPGKGGKPPKPGNGGNDGGVTPPKPPTPPRPGSTGAVRPGTSGGAAPRPGGGSATPPRPSGTPSPAPATPSTSSRPSGSTTPSTPPPRPGGSQPPKRI